MNSKIQELLSSDKTVFAFDVDGVLAPMEFGEYNHYYADDDVWAADHNRDSPDHCERSTDGQDPERRRALCHRESDETRQQRKAGGIVPHRCRRTLQP